MIAKKIVKEVADVSINPGYELFEEASAIESATDKEVTILRSLGSVRELDLENDKIHFQEHIDKVDEKLAAIALVKNVVVEEEPVVVEPK